jgi:hypothetical protein
LLGGVKFELLENNGVAPTLKSSSQIIFGEFEFPLAKSIATTMPVPLR